MDNTSFLEGTWGVMRKKHMWTVGVPCCASGGEMGLGFLNLPQHFGLLLASKQGREV